MTDSEFDVRMMAAALTMGARNRGRTWPNPAVGCILVHDGVVVARGATAVGGRPHAEPSALAAAGAAARGATAYVTLEPCAHHGRTPPCADALAASGIARVVSTIDDPDPRVAGEGYARLRAAGVNVVTGVLARQARLAHAGHFSRIRRGRPFVTLKLAVSADGCIGREGEGQVAISGPESRAYAHRLRADADAILVGLGTVLADDPLLTCRLPGLADRSPVRVILDAEARLPLGSKLVASLAEAPLWVVTGLRAPQERREALARAGVRLLLADTAPDGRIDLASALAALGAAGLTTVLVEGGARIARALLEAELVDEALIVEAPDPIGAGGIPALAGLPLSQLGATPHFAVDARARLGRDRLTRFIAREWL